MPPRAENGKRCPPRVLPSENSLLERHRHLFREQAPRCGSRRLDASMQHHFFAHFFPGMVSRPAGPDGAPDGAQFSVSPLHILGQFRVGDGEQIGADILPFGTDRRLRKSPFGL